MLQMGNIVKNPRIWIPVLLSAAITGPISTCIFHLENIPIGSGMAEAGCKLNLGRLKGPGMHWRFDNGIRIALLRATLRSRMFITA